MSYYRDNPLSDDGRPQNEVIDRNSAKCNGCGDEIESTHRHDFRSCSCGGVSVDGGKVYLRREFQFDGPGYEDTSLMHYEPMTNAQIAEYHGYKLF